MTATRITIATDAWPPQVNGVVTTLERTAAELGALGFEVLVLNPGLFRTVPCPSYPSIRLAIAPRQVVAARLSELAPHAVHVATEGPIGHAVRRYCLRAGLSPAPTIPSSRSICGCAGRCPSIGPMRT